MQRAPMPALAQRSPVMVRGPTIGSPEAGTAAADVSTLHASRRRTSRAVEGSVGWYLRRSIVTAEVSPHVAESYVGARDDRLSAAGSFRG